MPLVVYVLGGVMFLMVTTGYTVAGLLPEMSPGSTWAWPALVSLAGPESGFARENVVPLACKPAMNATIIATLNAVSAKLTTTVLLQLGNAIITQDYATVAAGFLKPKAWADPVSQRNSPTACAGWPRAGLEHSSTPGASALRRRPGAEAAGPGTGRHRDGPSKLVCTPTSEGRRTMSGDVERRRAAQRPQIRGDGRGAHMRVDQLWQHEAAAQVMLDSFVAHGGQHFHGRCLGHAGWRGEMIGSWGPLPDRTLLPVASPVLVRAVSCPVPGCSSGSRRRPA
jgi:hypothetical protein